MRKSFTPLMLLAGLSLSFGAQATPINVDGKPGDWMIDPVTWKSTLQGVQQEIEDQVGSGAYYLNPGWGGQAYDAEAIYALKTKTHLYIALFTGHDPETPNKPKQNSYGAGDFAIDFGRDGSYEVGINVKPRWDTFGNDDENGGVGGVYKVSSWAYGVWEDDPHTGYVKFEHPTSIILGDHLGLADLDISGPMKGFGSYTKDKHYFYEVGLSLDLLSKAGWNGKDAFNIHWTQNCANDYILVDPPGQVPEPATLALLPLGLLGLVAMRRRGSS